ncbi:nuclear transcription factor Y subunit gamma [Carica papaya]|uniref:nuclear transcription factor Y subunit gamma n=1 Tax=Carica papaya TaxID=3649 RepID=UPI000B8CE40E|nr:nuclear transcription factor Y subunit gamma [Carica papaya]
MPRSSMAEEENTEPVRPGFPTPRVKRIMKLDKDINKVNSEALFLTTCCADLFLRFLVEKSAEIVAEKKRKTLKLEDLRIAVKRHRPTSDFLLDSLPIPTVSMDRLVTDRAQSRPIAEKPVPAGTRRIDSFFRKSENEAPTETNDS